MTTPMMAQWEVCKAQAGDALLLFRLGDFYEAFHDDALKIAKAVGITLTARQGTPMCGVPFHTAEGYIDKLVGKGFKVAVAEQIEDPKAVKGLVKREIVRVVTPGTLINSQLLSDKKNNYFACIAQIGSVFGIATLDISTGEFRTIETEKLSELSDELHRLRPAEILVSKKFKHSHPNLFTEISHGFPFILNEKEEWRFDPKSSAELLQAHFKVHTLDTFGLKGQLSSVAAAGALLGTLKQELNFRLDHVESICPDFLQSYMALDRSTLHNLELDTSLLNFLDRTATPMGARLLTSWIKHPLLNIPEIERRQDAIAELIDHDQIHSLDDVRDLERLMMKTAANYGTPRDLLALGLSLAKIPQLYEELLPFSSPEILALREKLIDPVSIKIIASLSETPPLRIGEGELFKDGVHPDLDRLRVLSRDSITWMARYQSRLREETGIKTLKVGYTKAYGYYIEMSRAHGETIPVGFQRQQTLLHAERFITDELKTYEYQVLTAEERSKALEIQMFEELRVEVAKHAAIVNRTAKAIARIDVLLSLARVAKENRWTRPLIDESDVLEIREGRHPIVEKAVGRASFISNDTNLSRQAQLMIITGPNMAGKSTYIRQTALICILAQMGSYIPATTARIGLIDKIFSRIGASDDLARGQSTFMVEMAETANILKTATSHSLVLLDEIGRGTSTYDGISIAWAVAEYLLTTPASAAKTLFATHYWELTKLEQEIKGAVNYQVAVSETAEGIVFLRKIIQGGTDKSYGIHVAKLAGLPTKAIKRAQEMLGALEAKQAQVRKKQEEQLSFFTPPQKAKTIESEAIKQLKLTDIDRLTPMDALLLLSELKRLASLI
jgi:DNA mismatch repair protein MutS